MAIRRAIVIGDKTTHGGTVLQGSYDMSVNGKNISLEGDLVACPQCKGNFPIIEGSPFMSSNGRGVALEGMKTACGAVLMASQNLMKADDGFGDSRVTPASYDVPASFPNSSENSSSRDDNNDEEEKQFQYTHYFILKNEQGDPWSGITYIAKSKRAEHKGKLDINGKTKVISTEITPEEIELFIEISNQDKKRERYITKAMSDIKDKNSFTEYTVPEEKADIIFIGGAGDQEPYYIGKRTRVIEEAQRYLFERVSGSQMYYVINSHVIGYNHAYYNERIKELESKLNRTNLIYIIGHSLGGWNGAHLATILANKGYSIKMLITLDPVGTTTLVSTISGIYWDPETAPKAEKWINIRAETEQFHMSNIIANIGGQWDIEKGPMINETVDVIHADAGGIFATKLSTGLSALDYLLNDLGESFSWLDSDF
ncbi:PAAR domain-containing protein [Aggregatibacter actinomycetemcomitans]|uniref:PAAR domain-containing protein n=1 Tax=Aggregatibacter actinomycetemcomitans TaxID=714 RepID=UPI001F122878|nr:PAAR domain-containing protein [Aggregatibacter actinomycetemcomitans]